MSIQVEREPDIGNQVDVEDDDVKDLMFKVLKQLRLLNSRFEEVFDTKIYEEDING